MARAIGVRRQFPELGWGDWRTPARVRGLRVRWLRLTGDSALG